jgi:predicted small lipoprotein YifL
MKANRFATTVLAAAMLIAGLAGCQKEGPAESAGKKVDRAIDKTGQAIENTGDKVRNAAKNDKK